MPVLKLHNESNLDVVTVPGEFIDFYMPQASGEFVKVYLSLLRRMGDGGELTVSGLADSLNHTENDIVRALKYWERMGLLRLGYVKEELRDITFTQCSGNDHRETAVRSAAAETENRVAAYESAAAKIGAALPEKDPLSLRRLEGDEEFKQLLFVAGQYIGAPLSRKDCDIFAYLYDQLKMPAELLEYLIEYCISMGHKSVRYMEAVALDLHKREVATVEQAKSALPSVKKDHYAVMKAFGLNSRSPSPGEKKMMDKWFSVCGFGLDLVLEACGRTMSAIHKPSFEYADKILEAWKEKGVKVMSDVRALDQKRSQEKAKKPSKNTSGRTSASVRPNQFHNFEQREYDFDELMRQINQQ